MYPSPRIGSVSSEKLVQACIDRITEVNALINAVVDTRFEAALEEARSCDRWRKTRASSQLELTIAN